MPIPSLLVAQILPPWSSMILRTMESPMPLPPLEEFLVEPVEDVGQIFGRNAFSIILNLNLDKISHILDADIDDTPLFVQIFHRVTDDVVDHPLHLLRIGNHHHIFINIVKISQFNVAGIQLQSHILHTVPEIAGYIDLGEGLWDLIRVDLGIKRQLIDQTIHIIGLVINGADIFVQFFRR